MRVEIGVAGEEIPAAGEMGADFHLRAVHALGSGEDIQERVVGIGFARIELGGLEHGGAEGQAAVRKIPFCSEFESAVFLGREIGCSGAERQRFGGGIERRTGIEIDAADGNRLIDQRGAPARHFVHAMERGNGRDLLGVVGIEAIPAEAARQIPVRAELQGVQKRKRRK